MYEIRDNILTISVNDWIASGLTDRQYRHDKDLADKLDPTFIYNRILIRVYVDTQGKIFFIKPITKTEPYISAIFKVLEREDFPAFNAGIKKGLKVNSLYIINLNFRK